MGDLMIYIYNCYGGTHSSSLAAAVHLRKLPHDRIPTSEEILATEHFNKLTYKDMGKIIYRGIDDDGNKVFSIGRGTSKVLIPCIQNLIMLLYNECGIREKIVLSNMSPTVPPAMTMGGFFSRAAHIDVIGVPLLVLGAKQAYHKVLSIVYKTRDQAKRLDGPVLVLENKEYER